MTLGELIQVLGGRLVRGDPEWRSKGVNSVELASATDLVFAEDAASAAKALASNAGVVVLRTGASDVYFAGQVRRRG